MLVFFFIEVSVLREGKGPHFTTLASNSTHKTEKRDTDSTLILPPSPGCLKVYVKLHGKERLKSKQGFEVTPRNLQHKTPRTNRFC